MRILTKFKVLLISLTIAACGTGIWGSNDKPVANGQDNETRVGPEHPEYQTDPLYLSNSMKTFSNCAEVERYIEDQQVLSQERSIDGQIHWIKNYRGRVAAENKVEVNPGAQEADTAQGKSSSQGPGDYSTTNNQVEGVEEADIVKNDGTQIYHLAAGKLNILQSWPADSLKSLSTYSFTGRMSQILLRGKQLILLGSPDFSEVPAEYIPEWVSRASEGFRPRYSHEFTKVLVVDISDPTNPVTVDTYMMKGSLRQARRIGGSIRLILSEYGRQALGVKTWLDWNLSKGLSNAESIEAFESLKQENEKLIRAQDLDYWLGGDTVTRGVDSEKVSALDLQNCSSIHAPSVETLFGITRIATLNLQKQSIFQTVLLSHTSQEYANTNSLYLATPYHWWNDGSRNTNYTYIHKFDLSDPDNVAYSGSGGVQGALLNQFAMDEFNGVLRVATTINERVPKAEDSQMWDSWTQSNRVTALGLKGGELTILGQSEDLAENERIYSVRFHGDRGFLVTFRQVDPLFTLSLADPTNIQVVGELKIPGFSNYMQMLDENHIIAIGQDGTIEGQILGLKLSIFDVSDMSNPREIHKYNIQGGIGSEASYDHKAFTYFPAKKLLGIPVSGYTQNSGSNWYDRYHSSLLLFNIDTLAGFSPKGSVEMNDIYLDQERGWWWWRNSARVNRSIFADDFVYAISDLGIRVQSLENLTIPLATVRYPCNEDCLR